MKIRTGYTFDDVLLVPQYSAIESRSLINLSVHLGKDVQLSIPIVSANMKHVTEMNMVRALVAEGGLPIFHRFASQDFLVECAKQLSLELNLLGFFGFSVGVQESDKLLVDRLMEVNCKVLCVDVAHGDHSNCARMTEYIAQRYPDTLIIAGNVATASGAIRLSNAGADVIKVGIGGGSLCTTRIETGNGVPQLSALEDVRFDSNGNRRKLKIISDGGIRRAGDIVKALCFADAVMIGSLFAGTEEAPGKIVTTRDGLQYKEYAGSSTHKTNHVEGVSALVPKTGQVSDVLRGLIEGVRSGFSYQGASSIDQLQENPVFITLTSAGLQESHPHDVILKGI